MGPHCAALPDRPVDVIYRDDAAGGKVAETIPVPGVTTEMLTAKAVVIAGAMKRPPAMVHLSQAPTGVPGHVEILFLDIDPGRTKPRRFAYLGKPVIYARFDREEYESRHAAPSWFDVEREGYGPVTETLEGTLDELERVLTGGCVQEQVYRERIERLLTYHDHQNAQRLLEAIEARLAERAEALR